MTLQPAQVVLPDAAAEVVNYLATHVMYPVGRSLRGWSGGPHIQVTRTGGALRGVIDAAEIQLDARGTDPDEALDVAAAVRFALAGMPLGVPGCVGARELVGPTWLPEGTEPDQARWVMEWSVSFAGR